MTHMRRVVLPLRILLVIVFSALVAAQIWAVPAVLPDLAEPTLERTLMRWAMGAVAVLGLACMQAVLVCTWKLLTMVTNDRIFSASSLPWVNGIVWAIAVGWLMLFGTFVCSYYFIVDEVSDDPVPVALLRQATTLRADMEAVI